jgi:hypothetical protein
VVEGADGGAEKSAEGVEDGADESNDDMLRESMLLRYSQVQKGVVTFWW